MRRSFGIIVLCASLASAPYLRADALTPTAEAVATAVASPEPSTAPTTEPTPELGEVPKPNAHAEKSGTSMWSQVAWGALTVALIVVLVVIISKQPHSSNSGGSSYGY